MKRIRMLTWAGVLVGLAGMAWFFSQFDLEAVLAQVRRLPPALLLVVPAIGIAITMSTLSWAHAFPAAADSRRPPLPVLFTIRLAGEAINNALASAYVAGEPVKGLLASRHGAAPAAAYASALIGKTTFICGEVLFLTVNVVVAAAHFGRSAPVVTMLMSVAGAGLAIAVLGIVLQRRRLVGRSARMLRMLRFGPRSLWERAMPGADAIDEAVRRYYRTQRSEFWISVLFAAAGWFAGTVEVYAFLRVGTDVADPLRTALVLEAGIAVAKGLSFFVPGSYGAQEGAIAWLFVTTGVGSAAGVTYAVFRRFRELVWISLGFASLWWHVGRAGYCRRHSS